MITEEWPYSLADMEGMIGGSSLDELRDLMNIDSLENDDIIFKLVPDFTVDFTTDSFMRDIYGIPKGYTFIAHCVKFTTSDFKLVESQNQPEPLYTEYEWIPV